MAKNSSPARIVRESIETPATRARGSSPAPGAASIGSEICRSVHRINSSKSWRYEDTAHVGQFSPFEGSSLVRVTTARSASLPLSIKRATCQTLGRSPSGHIHARAARHFAIVKFQCAVGENLVILVTLPSQQQDVSGARFVHRQADGFLAVGLD